MPQKYVFVPPERLLQDIELPSRANIKTTGDMARIIIADEEAIAMKNADLKALRNYRQSLMELDK